MFDIVFRRPNSKGKLHRVFWGTLKTFTQNDISIFAHQINRNLISYLFFKKSGKQPKITKNTQKSSILPYVVHQC